MSRLSLDENLQLRLFGPFPSLVHRVHPPHPVLLSNFLFVSPARRIARTGWMQKWNAT